MITGKNFIDRNDSFTCLQCSFKNPGAKKTCRNHCAQCLYSLHVDDTVPGDRASTCKGLMKPIGLDYSGKKGHVIMHQCLKCEKKMNNMVASDDGPEALTALSLKIYES